MMAGNGLWKCLELIYSLTTVPVNICRDLEFMVRFAGSKLGEKKGRGLWGRDRSRSGHPYFVYLHILSPHRPEARRLGVANLY